MVPSCSPLQPEVIAYFVLPDNADTNVSDRSSSFWGPTIMLGSDSQEDCSRVCT